MKIAFVVSRFPYPLEKGDKLRAYHFIKQLSRFNKIILFAVTDSKVSSSQLKALEPFCSSIYYHRKKRISIAASLIRNVFSSLPFSVAYFYSSSAKKKWKKIIEKEKPDLIFSQLIRTAPYTTQQVGLKVLDYMDCFSQGMYQREQQSYGFMRTVYGAEYERLRKYEQRCYSKFSAHTIISEEDRKKFSFKEKDSIRLIPNGVNTDYFVPVQKEKTYDLLFTGNMSYPPNVNAVILLAKKILPLVWRKRPQTNLLIAGASPSKEVKALQSDKIKVSGWMDDIRDGYISSRLFVAPMQIGIGMQNKVLEAMSMQIPCVVSTMVNHAIHAETGREIVTANTPEEFSETILRLLTDEREANQLAEAGRKFVLKNHNWDSIGEELNHLITHL